MSHVALTAKYRPQTFSQVAGQETVKAILSRASLEQKVASAYLFSGTRGVGKTTLARIFAKALNCRRGPAKEPCNSCDQCRAIAIGGAVDVVEIDGASNRGIDDVRRLKEVVGYAPMEGAYKIFIIDEAHMLSREAFNALLKTLEEPPAKVTFIMATTEPHKFPATIISRCQHFVFKSLPESALVAHLSGVLEAEGISFDESAVRLIARRGAGSVRDSMSLLGQVLALGTGSLTEDSARSVLGLAGQEAFIQLLEAVRKGDSIALSSLLRGMLEQGLDMGFFLRELASLWRNLFMLRQSGEQALPVVELPENEARRYLELSQGFSLPHIHACWQMTLEGQRRVLTSLEPALALELLLLNIGMLPELLSLEKISAMGRKSSVSGGTSGTPGGAPSVPGASGRGPEAAGKASAAEESAADALPAEEIPSVKYTENTNHTEPEAVLSEILEAQAKPSATAAGAVMEPVDILRDSGPAYKEQPAPGGVSCPDWETVFSIAEAMELAPWLVSVLRRLTGRWEEGCLLLEAQDNFTLDRMKEPEILAGFEGVLRHWCGGNVPRYSLSAEQRTRISRDELKARVLDHPLVKEVSRSFGGYVIDYGQLR